MLTLNKKGKDKAHPIALIKGGGKKLKNKKVYLIRKDVYKTYDSDDEDAGKMVEDKDADEFAELQIEYGHIQQVPDTFLDRNCLYVAGPSGSGKSTYVANFIKQYKKAYPFRQVVLFSRKPEDPVLDELNPMRIPINYSLVDDPIDLEELKESIVIFDDVSTISDTSIRNAVFHLIEDVLEVGRSYKITICVTNHLLTSYKKTRTILNESTHITFFPGCAGDHHIRRYLMAYQGMTKEQVKRIFRLPSRWITLFTNRPQYIMYSTGIYMLRS